MSSTFPDRTVRRKTRRSPLWLATLALLAVVAAPTGCIRKGPRVEPDPAAAITPPLYKEHRSLFVRADEATQAQWSLRFSYEAIEDELVVEHADPLSIIVNSVYMPRDFSGTKDIVVILDVQTEDQPEPISMAVWYQRDVAPGQKLGFENLLVHSQRAWNDAFQPYFKLRVIDVKTERNRETRALFDKINQAVGTLATFVPHPAVPAAAFAIRVAGLVLSNQQNQTIIDYTSQFYSKRLYDNAGPSDLAVLMRGSWIVVARPQKQTEEFWRQNLKLDRRTGQILTVGGAVVPSPYVHMTVATHEALVPTLALERSKKLFDLLAESRSPTGLRNAQPALHDLASAITTYAAHSRLVRNRGIGDLEAIMLLLENSETEELTGDDAQFLLSVVGRLRGQRFGSIEEALNWWSSTGRNGHIEAKTFRWLGSNP
ncbi:MAG: hypothetical protein KAY37_16540 [Phycisphaerae bacterium]|nr:hypothetical protein [Phycisphaerae bacterium]